LTIFPGSFIGLLLVVVTLAIFWQIRNHEFVWSGRALIVANLNLRAPADRNTFWRRRGAYFNLSPAFEDRGRLEEAARQYRQLCRSIPIMQMLTITLPPFCFGKAKGDGMRLATGALAVAGLSLVIGCSAPPPPQMNTLASADLKDKNGTSVGTATFREATGGVLVSVEVKGLTPGLHAVHVHAVGKCEGPAFTSAGGHFNPAQKKHGLRNPEGPHAGDMPNMYVAKDGTGRFEVLNDNISLKPGDRSVFDADGSALVIHAGVDDYVTDPTGNAGDRVACGVIRQP
jgi:Cu-Zn family superoxide dismutase